MTKDEIIQAESHSKERLTQTKTWIPKLKKWAASLMGSDTKDKIKTLEALQKLKDANAVLALQLIAVQLPDDVALPFVAAIKNVRSKEACDALVRIALADPSSKRGQEALVAHKDYPTVFYVPELVESLSTEIQTLRRVFVRPSGEQIVRQIQMKQFRDLEQFAVLDIVVNDNQSIGVSRPRNVTTTRPSGRQTGQLNLVASGEKNGVAQQVAMRDAAREVERTQHETQKNNVKDELRQNRVLDVLRALSGEELGSAPEGWWVAGRGWMRSKELEVGMQLHHATGTSRIESIEDGTEEVETYNLVVADYQTYFVGPERILSNDATELRPTLQVVPGLPSTVMATALK